MLPGLLSHRRPRDFHNSEEARRWFSLAAAQNDPDANYYLRQLWCNEHSIPKWRDICVVTIGYAFLIFHGWNAPFSVSASAIAGFLGIVMTCATLALIMMAALQKFGFQTWDAREADAVIERMESAMKKKPWQLLLIPAEDGCFLLPLLYIGITPASAAIAATLFAAAHYPTFPWRYCVPKGVAYFFVALFLLPKGIWSIVVAHLVLDLALILGPHFLKSAVAVTWQRLFRVLRSR